MIDGDALLAQFGDPIVYVIDESTGAPVLVMAANVHASGGRPRRHWLTENYLRAHLVAQFSGQNDGFVIRYEARSCASEHCQKQAMRWRVCHEDYACFSER